MSHFRVLLLTFISRGGMVGFDPGAPGVVLSPEEAALAESGAGMVTRALINPLDVVKIRFQVNGRLHLSSFK